MKIKSVQAVLITSLLTVAASYQSANAATFMQQVGSNCMAIFQSQAFELQWTEQHIKNLSTTRPLYVTCPVPRVTGTPNGLLNIVYNLTNSTGADQDVTAIARRYDQNGALQEAATDTVTVPASGNIVGNFATSDTPADFDYYSLTILLPQGVALTHYVND